MRRKNDISVFGQILFALMFALYCLGPNIVVGLALALAFLFGEGDLERAKNCALSAVPLIGPYLLYRYVLKPENQIV